MITQLTGGTDVVSVTDANAPKGWSHVRIWSGIDGYIPANRLGTQLPEKAREGVCNFPGVPEAYAETLPPDKGPWPLSAQGTLTQSATLSSQPDEASPPIASLADGQALSITQWITGLSGLPWYHVQTPAGSGWLWSGAVHLTLPDPDTHQVQGRPVWAGAAGKGMWFTNYLTHHADVDAMMRAAKLAGVTHVYAEVAISKFGFYARNSLDRLIPAAHAQGIKVIAWVYPSLDNVGDDIRLSTMVATYRTPSGDVPDGLACDLEENATGGNIYSYGQVLRGLLGPDELLVAAVFHPFTHAGYPYGAIAASWNVLAPMDYWHSHTRDYMPESVQRFVATSITHIRAAIVAAGGRADMPIEEIGQTYDMFTDDGTGGGNSPSAEEISADIATARDLGCIGISFYQWQTATQDQWQVITQSTW
jgi:hypothetical protein